MQFFAIFHSTDFALLVLCVSTRLAKWNRWGKYEGCLWRYFNNKTVLFMRLFFTHTHTHTHAYPNFQPRYLGKNVIYVPRLQLDAVPAAAAYASCLCLCLAPHLLYVSVGYFHSRECRLRCRINGSLFASKMKSSFFLGSSLAISL